MPRDCDHDYWMSTAEPVDEPTDGEVRLEVAMICDLCGHRKTVTTAETVRVG
jgi:hypothetical protein